MRADRECFQTVSLCDVRESERKTVLLFRNYVIIPDKIKLLVKILLSVAQL